MYSFGNFVLFPRVACESAFPIERQRFLASRRVGNAHGTPLGVGLRMKATPMGDTIPRIFSL